MNAIITGASRGIGKGVAVSLAKQGYDIHITGRSETNLSLIKKEIEKLGKQCITLP